MFKEDMTDPLPKGLEVPPHGKILDVWEWPMQSTGQVYRSYLLRNDQGLSWLPASVVERGKEVTKP